MVVHVGAASRSTRSLAQQAPTGSCNAGPNRAEHHGVWAFRGSQQTSLLSRSSARSPIKGSSSWRASFNSALQAARDECQRMLELLGFNQTSEFFGFMSRRFVPAA